MGPLYCSQWHENAPDSRFCRQCGEALTPAKGVPPAGNAMQGMLASRYRLIQELGQGGFGRTYLAEDTNRFNELCVLKEFAPQVQGEPALQKAEELFAREAGILYKLQHSQIPRFRELFRAEVQGKGRLFLVQDYVAGQTYQALLQSRWQQGYGFTEADVTQLLYQLLPVLTYIHDRGVIHRDISPDNLMYRNADGLPVLIDFGGVKQVAAAVISKVNPAGVVQVPGGVTLLGKAGYSPAEQLSDGMVFPHSDLYALAVTVLVLLTGKEPLSLLTGHRPSWQQEVALHPTLMAVLARMLDPIPDRRYQSAQEVWWALQGQTPLPAGGMTRPPLEQTAPPVQTAATLPLATPNQSHSPIQTQSLPGKTRRGVGMVIPLVVAIALGGAGLWAGNRWVLPWLAQFPLTKPPVTQPNKNPPKNDTPPGANFSPAEQARKQTIDKRQAELGIAPGFLAKLVNQVFYARHPELAGRQLTEGLEDESWRQEWDDIAITILNRLQSLSPAARSRLGQYTDADLKERQAAVNQLRLSSRALNDLTDAQFIYLFSGEISQDLLKQPLGQVWQAIADDQLKSLQSGNTLQPIKFPAGRFSEHISDRLKPGQGKAYTAQLSKDQTIRLQLQAEQAALRLSFYPPTSKSPALLEDTTTTEWSGKLTESGLYEIVVVATGNAAVAYELDLAAADDVTSGSTLPGENQTSPAKSEAKSEPDPPKAEN